MDARVAKPADARDLKSCGGSPSMWVRLPPRALFESPPPQAAQEIESRFRSLPGDLWMSWVFSTGNELALETTAQVDS